MEKGSFTRSDIELFFRPLEVGTMKYFRGRRALSRNTEKFATSVTWLENRERERGGGECG